MSTIQDLGSIPPQQIWDGVVVRAVEGERITMALAELDANAVIPEHRHENEQIGVVIEGSLTFTIDGETRELGPGGTWRILADTPHDVVVGPVGAIVVETFSPVRDDWDGLERRDPCPPRWPRPTATDEPPTAP